MCGSGTSKLSRLTQGVMAAPQEDEENKDETRQRASSGFGAEVSRTTSNIKGPQSKLLQPINPADPPKLSLKHLGQSPQK